MRPIRPMVLSFRCEKKSAAARELNDFGWVYNSGSHDTETPGGGGFRVHREASGGAEADSLAECRRTEYLWGGLVASGDIEDVDFPASVADLF